MEGPIVQLEHLFAKADSDLVAISNHLELEFARNSRSTEGCAPIKLLERLRALNEDIRVAHEEALILAAKKKEFAEFCGSELGRNQALLSSMMTSAGLESTTGPQDFGAMVWPPQVEGAPAPAEQLPAGFAAVTAEEWAAIPGTTKGRAKLEEVNRVYLALLTAHRKRGQLQFTAQELAEMGLKVAGTTGSARLQCLRFLGIVDVQKSGTVVLL